MTYYCDNCKKDYDEDEVRSIDRSTPESDGWEVTCKECGELLDED